MIKGTWIISATDDRLTKWDGSTLNFESQIASGSDFLLEGYFYWVGSDGNFGRENFTGILFSDNTIELSGFELVEPYYLIGTTNYFATLDSSGTKIIDGSWSAPGIVPSNDWSAILQIPVVIDIMPGSDTNSINIGSAGVIPVAILGSADFDVADIVPASVSLAGASVKLVGKSDKYLCHQEDVNLDGLTDLTCQIYTAEFFVEEGETTAILEAETLDGTKLRGEDVIRIVPDIIL